MTTTSGPARDIALSVTTLMDGAMHGEQGAEAGDMRAVPTGFGELDRALAGGLRAGDLVLLAGDPGTGKTIMALQWAVNIARSGRTALYACYEHDASALLGRLLCQEIGSRALPVDASSVDRTTEAIRVALLDGQPLSAVVERHQLLVEALDRVRRYAHRIRFVAASGTTTDVPRLRELMAEMDPKPVLFVDYLQKVAVAAPWATEEDRIARVAEQLKDLALSESIPIVAVAAASASGLKARRLRMHHLRGASALAYDSDIAMILNDKHRIVAKSHVAFDPVRAQTFKRCTILSIEKNRSGAAGMDLEFEKHFPTFRFDPNGRFVAERLIDERFDDD